jgi:hypothetical protein
MAKPADSETVAARLDSSPYLDLSDGMLSAMDQAEFGEGDISWIDDENYQDWSVWVACLDSE